MSKSLTYLLASSTAGRCSDCRHSNQETVDFNEGHIFCELDSSGKKTQQTCTVERDLFVTDEHGGTRRYFLFEPYDGANGTFGRLENRRIVRPEDASRGKKA